MTGQDRIGWDRAQRASCLAGWISAQTRMHAFRPVPCEPRTGWTAGWDTVENQQWLVSCEPVHWELSRHTYCITTGKTHLSKCNCETLGEERTTVHDNTVILCGEVFLTYALNDLPPFFTFLKLSRNTYIKRLSLAAVTYSMCPEYKHAQNTVKHIYYTCGTSASHLLQAEGEQWGGGMWKKGMSGWPRRSTMKNSSVLPEPCTILFPMLHLRRLSIVAYNMQVAVTACVWALLSTVVMKQRTWREKVTSIGTKRETAQ